MSSLSYQGIMTNRSVSPSYSIATNLKGRQLVIPDIHGCSQTLRALIELIGLTKNDQLFLLGDLIDKGPDSVGVIDFILELLADGYQILPLRGNHEQMLIASHQSAIPNDDRYVSLPRRFKRKGLVDRYYRFQDKYRNFFLKLPYSYELENHFLVHAGFNLSVSKPLKDYDAMLWIRDFNYDKTYLSNKTVIVGHEPKRLQVIKDDIIKKSALISLDNGCVYKSKPNLGNLLCLDINNHHLTIQPNIEVSV